LFELIGILENWKLLIKAYNQIQDTINSES